MTNLRIGNGFDVHPFKEGRDLILGGVKIDYKTGLHGHSDADALIHAIIDSLLSPASLGNIGSFFPDTDMRFKDISSLKLLQEVSKKIIQNEIKIVNIDSIIICQHPQISPYVNRMKKNISSALNNLDLNRIGIKGKTTENLGFTGRGEGIAVYSVSLIQVPY